MDNWIKAGKVAAEVLDYGKDLVKVDAKILDVVRKIEEKAKSLNAKFAFPVNVSINEVAAHYTAIPNDELKFKEGDLVKLDVGVHFDGCIGDNAVTIDLGDNRELVKASKEALDEAIKVVNPGIEVREIGKAIQEVISSYGFSPIKNLSGHTIEEYSLHAGLSIPNFDDGNTAKIEEGMIFAIEPFATDGEGKVIEGKGSTIYKLDNLKPTRNANARKIINFIQEEYKSLPFAKRWILKKFSNANFSLRLLENEKIIHHYSQLIEKARGKVSQAEHTILVEDKAKILTKVN